jgi:hypothetical protein
MSDYIEHACGWCGSLLHHVDKCSTKDNPSDDQRRIHYLQSRLTAAETRVKELEKYYNKVTGYVDGLRDGVYTQESFVRAVCNAAYDVRAELDKLKGKS